jgi:hypothetical protein
MPCANGDLIVDNANERVVQRAPSATGQNRRILSGGRSRVAVTPEGSHETVRVFQQTRTNTRYVDYCKLQICGCMHASVVACLRRGA